MRKTLIFLIGCLFPLIVAPAPIGRKQAMYTAREYLSAHGKILKAESLAFKAPRKDASSAENAYYYVFNVGDDNGYVIVSGDDRTDQILGYVETGTFDEENIPDNMRSWLQLYADQIKYLDDHNIQIDRRAVKAHRVSQTRHAVAPLMKSKWNQGSPYNNRCPVYYDAQGNSGTSVSGCVATALAQVINFYKYPVATTAAIPSHTNTYSTPTGTRTVRLNSISKGAKIDWDNMCDTYSGSETEDQKKAVADLMLYVGQAVKMGYGASSGAGFGDNIPAVMTKYFGFDDAVTMEYRNKYSIDGWFNLIYNEIASKHPVAMSGSSSGGAHAFVLDGFDGENLFHVNWGWGGGSDGYFLLQILNPGDSSGAGASTSSDGYSMGQDVLIGLNYPDDVKVESNMALTINDIEVNGLTIEGNFINWTGSTGTYRCGIVRVNPDGSCTVVSSTQTATNLSPNTFMHYSFSMRGKLNTPGTYKLSPASRLSTHRYWHPQMNMYNEYILAEVDENRNVTLTYHHPDAALEIEDIKFVGNCKVNKEQEVKVTFRNTGTDEYYDEVHIFTSKSNDMGKSNCRSAVCLKGGESCVTSFFFKPEETGVYNVWLTEHSDGRGIIGSSTVNITTNGSNNPNLSFASFSLSNGSGTTAYGNRMTGTVTVRNNKSTDYSGKIKLQLWIKNTTDNVCWASSSKIVEADIPANRTRILSFDFDGLEVGRTYFIAAYEDGTDTELTNGGLVWDHAVNVTSGILYWKQDGSIVGQAAKTSMLLPATSCGFLSDKVSMKRLTANKNPNTIYAFTAETAIPSGIENKNVVYAGKADSIHLVSGEPFYVPVDFKANYATFSHTFTRAGDGDAGWEAITLPFKADSLTIDGYPVTWVGDKACIALREFAYLSDDNEVVFEDVSSLRANAPYVIACNGELVGKTVVFTARNVEFCKSGSMKILVSSNAFNFYGSTYQNHVTGGYLLNEEGSAFVYSDARVNVPATVPYFTTSLPEEFRPESLPVGVVPELSTGVMEPRVSQTVGETGVYNLMGQRIASTDARGGKIVLHDLEPGIYVVNGKKILVK